jgi:type IV fimbrial biogenesis protein FimT
MLSRVSPLPGGPVRRTVHGFTLVELLVTLAVMAIGIALAAPSFAGMIANYRVRAGAESLVHAVSFARAQAARRNTSVRFVLTGVGTGWRVEQVSPSTVLQSRSDADAQGISATSSNAAVSVTFLPNGLVDATGTWLTSITVVSTVAGAESRRIDILGGGLVRMCDPSVTIADDSRRC